MNYSLKGLFVSKYGSKVAACKALRLSEWRMSRVIHGWEELRPDEVEILTSAFGDEVVSSVIPKSEGESRPNVA